MQKAPAGNICFIFDLHKAKKYEIGLKGKESLLKEGTFITKKLVEIKLLDYTLIQSGNRIV